MANLSGPPESDDASLETAEARMRRALGDLEHQGNGNGRAANDSTRPRAEPRTMDRHSGDRPRARFVQDGDVPVTVLNRARPHEGDAGNSRLSAAEAALASERTARSRAERSLAEMQATVHDLQTKWGHAELARQELAGRVEAEKTAFEAERAALQARMDELSGELATERETTARLSALPQPARRMAPPAEDDLAPQAPAASGSEKIVAVARKAKRIIRAKAAGPKQSEAKPVKWWLAAAKKK